MAAGLPKQLSIVPFSVASRVVTLCTHAIEKTLPLLFVFPVQHRLPA